MFVEIEKGIRECLNETDKLVFESTGLTDYFDHLLQSLKKDFQVATIGVYANSRICLDRIKTRDQTIHINISDDQVLMINKKVRERNFKTDFWIDNESKSEEELIIEISKIIEQTLSQNDGKKSPNS